MASRVDLPHDDIHVTPNPVIEPGHTAASVTDKISALVLKRKTPLVRTFTENLMAYALGRRVEYFDQPAIRGITRSAEANNYKISSFILGVVKSDAFRMKRAASAATEENGNQ